MIGFDKHSINSQLLLGLTLEERTGVLTHDRAKPTHPATLSGGTIAFGSLVNGLPYVDMTGATPDFLEIAAAATTDLDITTEDCSGVIWVYPGILAGNEHLLFCRGLLDTDGYYFLVLPTGELAFTTNQGAVNQVTQSTDQITINNLWCAGFTRIGDDVRLYIQGMEVDAYNFKDAHANPLTSNRKLLIGVYDDEATLGYDGRIIGGRLGPRLWSRGLSAREHREIFNMGRDAVGL